MLLSSLRRELMKVQWSRNEWHIKPFQCQCSIRSTKKGFYYFILGHSHARNCERKEKENLRQLPKRDYFSPFSCFLFLDNIFSCSITSFRLWQKKARVLEYFSQSYWSRIFSNEDVQYTYRENLVEDNSKAPSARK